MHRFAEANYGRRHGDREGRRGFERNTIESGWRRESDDPWKTEHASPVAKVAERTIGFARGDDFRVTALPIEVDPESARLEWNDHSLKFG